MPLIWKFPCDTLQEYCHAFNDWLQADTYLWVEALVTTTSESAWVSTVTVECSETVKNSWAAKIEFSKAARVYAAEKGISVNGVTEAILEKTSLGVRGYAELFEGNVAAQPRAGGDGSNARPPAGKAKAEARPVADDGLQVANTSPAPNQKRDFNEFWMPGQPGQAMEDGTIKKAKRGKGPNTMAKKEKEVKELLAQEQQSDNAMTAIAADMGKEPGWWGWAREAVTNYKMHRTEVLKLYADQPFFNAAKVAALSQKQTQKLRKDYGEDYVAKLCEFCTALGPKIVLMAEASFQIEQMANAKRSAVETLQRQRSGIPAKPKAKSKAGSKTKGGKKAQASAQSVQA